MMKKLIALLLCLSMALTFTACRIVIDGEENVDQLIQSNVISQ